MSQAHFSIDMMSQSCEYLIMKLTKKEIALCVAAIIIPGGGIAAGVYFLSKFKKAKKEKSDGIKISRRESD